MRRSSAFALLSITLLALYVRLVPVTRFLYWGADFGEYFGVTQGLAQGAPLSDPYLGWGVTYPEFPGMHAVLAMLSWTGLNLETVAILAVPTLAALTVVPVFLLLRHLTGRDEPGLVAALLLGVALPHVYTTAHAVPAALGHLLLATALLLLVRLDQEPRLGWILVPVGLGLTVVHHLSSYFLIVVTVVVLLWRVAVRGEFLSRLRPTLTFLTLLIAGNLLYWSLFTTRFREFLGFEQIPWWGTVLLLAAVPPVLLLLALLRPRVRWRYAPHFPRPTQGLLLVALTLPLAFALLLSLSLSSAPGTTIAVPPAFLLYASPTLVLLLLGPAGRKHFDFLPGGSWVTGAFLAITFSWVLGATVAPSFLIPYRHLEYLAVPLALFAGVGIVTLARGSRGRTGVVAGIVAVLVVLAALTALPPREALGNHFEGIHPEAMTGLQWAGSRVTGITATDHRASSALFGFFGIRATWDAAPRTLHASSFAEAEGEMRAVPNLPGGTGRVDYVLLDDDLIRGATLLPWDPALPLSAEALAKFEAVPFLKLYDDGYTQLYWVNWGLA